MQDGMSIRGRQRAAEWRSFSEGLPSRVLYPSGFPVQCREFVYILSLDILCIWSERMFLIDSETATFGSPRELSEPKHSGDTAAVQTRKLVAPLAPMLHSMYKLRQFACADPETSIG